MSARADLGLIGLAVMGQNLVLNMDDHGYTVAVYNRTTATVDEFLRVFDGYSIGSNDLTQLVLGIDRDSGTVAHLFDERNEAVRRVIAKAIEAAKRRASR